MPLIRAVTSGESSRPRVSVVRIQRARSRRRARDRISSANLQDRPVFRVTGEDAIEDIPPREVCAEVEDTGIARRRNGLDEPGETDFVAQLRIAFPARADGRGAGLAVAIELDRIEPEKKGRDSR